MTDRNILEMDYIHYQKSGEQGQDAGCNSEFFLGEQALTYVRIYNSWSKSPTWPPG